MEKIWTVQREGGTPKGYLSLKRLCRQEGLDYGKLPAAVRTGKVGFMAGGVTVSLMEVDRGLR